LRTSSIHGSAGESCQSIPAKHVCTERPNSITMLYNGGDCSQSDNLQPQAFLCEDYNGGPSTTKGEPSYVVVTDVLDKNITYFRGFVNVGDMYSLKSNGTIFESDQNISIYSSDMIVYDNLLQTVVFHTSCVVNLELNDVFGSSQVVQYSNTKQGNVTVFVPVIFDIWIQLGTNSDPAILNKLVVKTNLDYDEVSLSSKISNKTLYPGGKVSVGEAQFTLDISSRQTYIMTATITGTSIPSSSICTGTATASLDAGQFPSTRTMTITPSVGPSQSPSPTLDLLETKCNVVASIMCTTHRGMETSDCSQLQPPVLSRCVGSEPILAMELIYTGLPCNYTNTTGREFLCVTNNGGTQVNPPTPVFVTAQDADRRVTYFHDMVLVGDAFTVAPRQGSRFNGIIRLTVSTISDNLPSLVLQELKIRVTCNDDDDISLLTQYGSMQLAGFTSLTHGRQSAFESIQVRFAITNNGLTKAIVRHAIIDSELFGTRDIITAPGVEFRRDQSESFIFKGLLNLYDGAGQQFSNKLSLNGTSVQNNLTCSNRAEMTVVIGE
jgi:hypothetical protein